MSASPACLAATPAIQSTLQACGFELDSTGKPSIPANSTPTQVYTCLCNSASLSVFTNTLTACAADPVTAANLQSLISGCPTVAAAAGTGAGTGSSGSSGQSTCEASIQQGIESLGVCGVTVDAAGLLKQTGTADQTSKCLCTSTNVALYKGAITVCEGEVKQTSPQGVIIAKQLVASCESGNGTIPGTGAGAASGAVSAVASAAASSTSRAAVATSAVVSTTKGSGGSSAVVMVGVFAVAALFV
ncbi:hypothetical protein HDU81_000246 [Chytriomyces hyalinus]|nr:hypothetical protein HDU81_000246 [Chytriomyces hyalinus]